MQTVQGITLSAPGYGKAAPEELPDYSRKCVNAGKNMELQDRIVVA